MRILSFYALPYYISFNNSFAKLQTNFRFVRKGILFRDNLNEENQKETKCNMILIFFDARWKTIQSFVVEG